MTMSDVREQQRSQAELLAHLISIKKMHKWVFEERKGKLSFIFVDYEEKDKLRILNNPKLIPIEHISWDCLSIEAQGYGVIHRERLVL